jgi:hypothetical protein
MRLLFKLGVLGLAAFGAKTLYERFAASSTAGGSGGTGGGSAIDLSSARASGVQSGRDTATGTDPSAKYAQPGYEDKSLGQAVQQDQQLVDRLVSETGGDMHAAESRFRAESAGSPALARQEHEPGGSGS